MYGQRRMNCRMSPRRLLLPLPLPLPLPPLELGLLSGALRLKLVADPPAPDEEEEDDEVGSLATSSCLRSIRGVGACMVNTARTAQKKKTPAGQNPCCRVGRLN